MQFDFLYNIPIIAPFLVIGAGLFSIVFMLILAILKYCFNCGIYHLNHSETLLLNKKIQFAESVKGGRPFGWFLTFNSYGFCIGRIMDDTDGRRTAQLKANILASEKFIIGTGISNASYSKLWYSALNQYTSCIGVENQIKIVNHNQQKAIEGMEKIYNDKKYCKTLLYGKEGTGKTFTKFAIGTLYKYANYYTNYNPMRAIETFKQIYFSVEPSFDTPLIINIDEVDQIVASLDAKINKGSADGVKDANTNERGYICEINVKKDWSAFFDAFNDGEYPYVYLIMTTNKPREYFDNLDKSYLRDNRVDFIMEFT